MIYDNKSIPLINYSAMWPLVENRLRHQYWMERIGSGDSWESHFVTLYRVSFYYTNNFVIL